MMALNASRIEPIKIIAAQNTMGYGGDGLLFAASASNPVALGVNWGEKRFSLISSEKVVSRASTSGNLSGWL